MKYTRYVVEADGQSSEPRRRSRTHYLSTALHVWAGHNWETTPPIPQVRNSTLIRESAEMDDVVTRGFKKLSNQGQIINSPMTRSSIGVGIVLGRSIHQDPPSQYGQFFYRQSEGAVGLYLPTTAADATNLINIASLDVLDVPNRSRLIGLAATEARANISPPDFQGLVSLGELRETLGYLRNPFKTGLKLAHTLQSKSAAIRRGKSQAVASDLASLYLEFRYAVRPMIKEVEGALTTLRGKPFVPIRHTARAKKLWSSEVSYPDTVATEYYQTATIKRVYEHELTVRCGFLYEHTGDQGLNDTWGMRLSDVPAAMWELVPLSFVYDWFGNMGDYISAMTPMMGIRHLSNWTTVTETKRLTYLSVPHANQVSVPSKATITQTTKSRTPSVNIPSLELRDFDSLANDALKLLDLIGISKQKLSTSLKPGMASDKEVARLERFGKRINEFRLR